MAAIFISHSSRDDTLADEVRALLAKDGYEQVFLDFNKHTGLQAGENWERRLYEEIDRCHAVVLILTPSWLDSKWCFIEFTQARALGKIIFPLVLSPLGDKRVAPEIQGVDLRDWNAEGQEYLRRRIREVTDEVARGFAWDRSRCPYPGINSFDRADAAIFFGRDLEIRQATERLEARRVQGGKRLILVLGGSGTGKSSLLKAGIVPQLERDRAHWIVMPPFRPEREPLTNMAKALAEKAGRQDSWREWRDRLAGAEAGTFMAELADDLRIGDARSATVLLSIDQFEEAFTAADPRERQRFLDVLGLCVGPEAKLPYLVVATIRSDILTGVLDTNQFTLPFEDFLLAPIALNQIPKIVEGPAGVAALTIEKGLPHRVAEDVTSADALPLLAFALRELFERYGRERRLTIPDYEKLGDPAAGLSPMENAVRRRAEDVLTSLRPSPRELDELKRAFIPGLVQVREDGTFARQPALLSALPPGARKLIDSFTDARLLTKPASSPEADTVVEVSHESLFRAWPLLAGWLNGEREFLLGKAQLARSLAEWRAAAPRQKADALLQGLQLKRARQLLANHPYGFSDEERSFIKASDQRARRRVWALSGLSAAVVALIIALAAPRMYAAYAFRTALDCDKYAAEQDNNVHVPGVEFDQIRVEVAIPACQSAVAAQPGNVRLMHNLGRSLDKAGRFEEANSWYGKAADHGWAWSENNLGVNYIYGRGTPVNFAKGVALIRAAAEKNNDQAALNYAGTDYNVFFDGNDKLASILETGLVAKGALAPQEVQGRWSAKIPMALDRFKQEAKLPDKGITLRVLNALGVVDKLSAQMSGGA
jgi:conflict system STAND superfamily ATPase/TIR domain-containing protein